MHNNTYVTKVPKLIELTEEKYQILIHKNTCYQIIITNRTRTINNHPKPELSIQTTKLSQKTNQNKNQTKNNNQVIIPRVLHTRLSRFARP